MGHQWWNLKKIRAEHGQGPAKQISLCIAFQKDWRLQILHSQNDNPILKSSYFSYIVADN